MPTYTVVGLYANGDRFADHYDAVDPNDAEQQAIEGTLTNGDPLNIAGVFLGKLHAVA